MASEVDLGNRLSANKHVALRRLDLVDLQVAVSVAAVAQEPVVERDCLQEDSGVPIRGDVPPYLV